MWEASGFLIIWVSADSRRTLSITNPANGSTHGNVPNAGAAETRRAVGAAALALPSWRARTAGDRDALLRCWHQLIVEFTDDRDIILKGESIWQHRHVAPTSSPKAWMRQV